MKHLYIKVLDGLEIERDTMTDAEAEHANAVLAHHGQDSQWERVPDIKPKKQDKY